MTGPTVREILAKSTDYLSGRGVDSPRLSAELLLAEALGTDRLHLFLNMDRPLGPEEIGRARDFVARRGRGEPAAYILGRREFWGLGFQVTPDVLVPRPETECLVEEALQRLPKDRPLLAADLGTGSGCLAVSLARHLPLARVVAVDVSRAAVEVARANAAAHGVSDRVLCLQADAARCPLPGGSLDLVVANPPYVSDAEYAQVSREVRDFEPRLALCGGPDGLDCVRAQVPETARLLRPGGLALMEIGCGQGPAARTAFESTAGFARVTVLRDLAGLDRVVAAERS